MKTQLHAELAQVKRSLAITQLLGAPGILLIGLALYGLVIAEGDAFIQALNNPINCYLLIAIGSAITLWEALKIIKLSKQQTQLLKQLDECNGHCCKVSDEAAFCLIQRPYISKTLLTRRISP
ncbi:hypothetical protein, partial [Klebsiella pneumoniae]